MTRIIRTIDYCPNNISDLEVGQYAYVLSPKCEERDGVIYISNESVYFKYPKETYLKSLTGLIQKAPMGAVILTLTHPVETLLRNSAPKSWLRQWRKYQRVILLNEEEDIKQYAQFMVTCLEKSQNDDWSW
jgi:hypothetical protein